jgi:hypothetical protein
MHSNVSIIVGAAILRVKDTLPSPRKLSGYPHHYNRSKKNIRTNLRIEVG